jgi:DNA-binding transcriptional MerR regulator
VHNLRVLKERQTFTISQAAEALSVTPSWLRFGERLGALPLARRDSKGWRYYTPEDIERLRRLGVGQGKQQLPTGGNE